MSRTSLEASVNRAAGTVAGLAAGWLAFVVIVWAYGEAPRDVAAKLVEGTWGTSYGIGQVLYKATTLLMTGTAVDLALRGGLFNIGVEGQLAMAALLAATAGARLPAATPGWAALPVVFAVAAMTGGAWAAIPAMLRALGAHEVISTLMMNRVADAAVGVALARGLGLPGTSRTPDIVNGARLARLDALGFPSMHGAAASAAWPIALVLAALASAWIARTRIGREVVLAGLSPEACAAEGIAPGRRAAVALVLSGALAGLAAIAPVLGYKGYYESGLAAGAGFGGIAVALLARRSLVGLVLAALFFGTLEQGGLAINAQIPMEVTTLIEAVAIVAVALADVRSGLARRPQGAS